MFKYFLVPEKLYLKLKRDLTEDDLREMAEIGKTAPVLQDDVSVEGQTQTRLSATQNLPITASSQTEERASPSTKRKLEEQPQDNKRLRLSPSEDAPSVSVEEARKGIKRAADIEDYNTETPIKRQKLPKEGDWLRSEEFDNSLNRSSFEKELEEEPFRQKRQTVISEEEPTPKRLKLPVLPSFSSTNTNSPRILPRWMEELGSSLELSSEPNLHTENKPTISSWMRR